MSLSFILPHPPEDIKKKTIVPNSRNSIGQIVQKRLVHKVQPSPLDDSEHKAFLRSCRIEGGPSGDGVICTRGGIVSTSAAERRHDAK